VGVDNQIRYCKIPNLSSQNAHPQICGLQKFVRFAEFPHMWHISNLQFADPIFFVICGFVFCGIAIADPNFLGELKTSASPQIQSI
jgi:hypothetical protein